MNFAKLLIVTILVLFTFSCCEKANIDGTPDTIENTLEKKENEQQSEVSKINLSNDYYVSFYILNDEENNLNNGCRRIMAFTFFDMNNEKMKSVNEALETATLGWPSGKVLDVTIDVSPIIHCCNERYLCISNEYLYDYPYVDNEGNINEDGDGYYDSCILDCITIDIQKGNRVFLKDFVNVNDEFIEYLMTESDICYWFKDNTKEEVKEKLEECSMTQQEILEKIGIPLTESIESILFRSTFYIKPGKLVFLMWDAFSPLEIDCSDVEQFLKVEPW